MSLAPLERFSTQTLLGIRFWDRITGNPVTGGLRVVAQRLSPDRTQRLGKAILGRLTPSGVITFFGLSGAERVGGDPTDQLWETTPPDQLVAIDLKDDLGRYLPISFVARMPFRGAFKGRGDWLTTPLLRPVPEIGDEMGVQLWSAPTRPLPAGQAVIRAQLVVGDSQEAPPASYALVEVTQPVSGPPPEEPFQHFGITSADGQLILPLPYPPVPDPPGDDYPPLEQQQFPLTITVRYSDSRTTLVGSDVPDLESILTQPQVDIGTFWDDDDPPELQTSSTLDRVLGFDSILVLRTALGSLEANETESVLRILPT